MKIYYHELWDTIYYYNPEDRYVYMLVCVNGDWFYAQVRRPTDIKTLIYIGKI